MTEAAAQTVQGTGISASRRFFKNWGYLFTSSVFCQALGMISLIRVARLLEPAGLGYFNIVQTSAGMGLVIAGLGMRNVIIRACARKPEDTRSLYFTSLLIRFLFSLIVGLGIILFALISPRVLPLSLSGFAIMLLLGQMMWDTTESISFGLQRMEFSSWINAIGSTLWVIWVWCIPASIITVGIICLSFASLQILKAVLLGWQVKRVIPPARLHEMPNQKKAILSLVVASLPFYWEMMVLTISQGLPILLLAHRSNPEQVGLFNVGFRLLYPLRLLFLSSTSVLYPYLSNTRIKNPAHYIRTVEKALQAGLIIGSGSAFLVFLLREEVVNILFGEKYIGSADAMGYQCWFLILLAIKYLFGITFLASDRQRLWAVLATIFTSIELPIIWFGADHGATGLALAMAVGAAISLVVCWPFFLKCFPKGFQSKNIIRPFIILGMAIISSFLLPDKIALSFRIPIAFLIFLILAIFLFKEWKNRSLPSDI